MALSDADQQLILDQIKYISSPSFKRDIFTGQSQEEIDARKAFIATLPTVNGGPAITADELANAVITKIEGLRLQP